MVREGGRGCSRLKEGSTKTSREINGRRRCGKLGDWTEIFMGLNDNWTEGGVTTATREKGHQQAGDI